MFVLRSLKARRSGSSFGVTLCVGALNQRDYTMLEGMMEIYTLAVVAVNVLTDLAYGLVDPRVKLG